MRLHSVSVLQEGIEGPRDGVDISKEIAIEITYWNLKPGARLYTALHLCDQSGTEILSSGTAKGVPLVDDPWDGAEFSCRQYRTTCRIPPNLLNDKHYTFRVIIGEKPSQSHVWTEFVFGFQVHDSGLMRQEYYGEWYGCIRPRLGWATEEIGPGAEAAAPAGKSAKARGS